MIFIYIRLIQIDFGTNHIGTLAIRALCAEIPLTRRHHMIFFFEVL
jgi:hypothetical protein